MRASWDEVWAAAAELMSRRSACQRAQIGAVIVSAANRVIATGYNGPPAGYSVIRHAESELEPATCYFDCPRNLTDDSAYGYQNCISVHAEANALMFCDRREREEGKLYVTEAPCFDCAKLISNSGLRRVEILRLGPPHRKPAESIQFMADSGLIVRNWNG